MSKSKKTEVALDDICPLSEAEAQTVDESILSYMEENNIIGTYSIKVVITPLEE